ncbi:MAG: ATP-binding cassette domain-containing protein [Alphaproteobacteria bacterium]
MRGRLVTLPKPEAPARERERLFSAEGVSIALGGRLVVRNVSLEVARGETVSLIGPNGSGKTTLVRALLGLVPVAKGRIAIEAGVRTGYVPQRFEPDPVLPLSVARFLRLGTKAARGRYDAVLAEVGCSHLARRQLVELSGGELRRVLIARALLRDPDLLVLDEPVQQVDVTGQLDLYRLIGRIRDEHHCGVLVVSHDLHIVMASTDRVICLNGHVCCSGAPEAVSRHPEYLALFGTRAAQGIAVYAHAHDHVHGPAGEVVSLDQPASAEAGTDAQNRQGAERR